MILLETQKSQPPSETTPLLHEAVCPSRPKRTPLPIRQLLVLAFIRLVDPISSTIISPFKNEVLTSYHRVQWGFNFPVDGNPPESNRQAIRDRVLLWLDCTHMSYEPFSD